MDSPPDSSFQPQRHPSRMLWPLLLCVLPFIVQAAYFDGGFYYDDDFHLEQSELISQGEITLWHYVTLPHGEHLIPLWKLMFYACWQAGGQDSFVIHLMVTAFHVASVFLLHALLLRYVSEQAALIVAVLWAGVAIGGWDGPFLWIAASHLSVGVTFLLAAMLALTRASDHRSNKFAVLMGGCVTACLLVMGSLLVVVPVLLLQYWLFESGKNISRKTQLSWLACWLLPCLVIGILHVVWVLPAMQQLDRPPADLYAGMQMLGGGYAISSGKLFFGGDNVLMLGRIAGVVLMVVLLSQTSRTAQKAVLLFFVMSLLFSLLAYMARSGWEVDHVLMWGRYRYLPTLFWCVVLGCVFDRVLSALRQHQQAVVPWVSAAALLLFVLSQVRIAHDAAAVFRQLSSESETAESNADQTQAALINIDIMLPAEIQFRTISHSRVTRAV